MIYYEAKDFKPGMEIAVAIKDISGHDLLREGTQLSDAFISNIEQRGIQGLYIHDEFSYGIEPNEELLPFNFSEGSNVFEKRDLEALKNIARKITEKVFSRKLEKMDIVKMQRYEDYEYFHALNVAIYSCVIGRYMKYSQEDVFLLTQAAVYHDIGMLDIPETITKKRGTLNANEYEQVKSHVKQSVNFLSERSVSRFVKDAVEQHHENENGTGYPQGLSGLMISDFAKIIHVADVMDAMTTKRPYKNPYVAADVLDYLSDGAGILFDEKVVNAVKECFNPYPLCFVVELSDNRKATIIGQTENPLRPRIMLLDGHKRVDLNEDPDYKYITIKAGSLSSPAPVHVSTPKPAQETQPKEPVKATVFSHVGEKKEPDSFVPAIEPEEIEELPKRPKVVVVDDIPINRRAVELALKNEYEVIPFPGGAECIDYFHDNGAPDLVIMDIEMPGIDGVTTVKTLRDEGYTDVPVIFLTSVNNRDVIMKCIQVGALDYILKPAKAIYIYERVNDILRKTL